MTRTRLWPLGLALLVTCTVASYALGHALSGDAEVRISARQLADGRVEFALQQRLSGEWGERLLPDVRFFPANPSSGRWLNSSVVQVETMLSTEAVADEIAPESTTKDSVGDPVTDSVACGADPDDWGSSVIAGIADAYRRVEGVWSGFDPNEIPAIVNYRTPSGEISADAVGFNLPEPALLGTAQPLSTMGTPFRSLHCLSNFNSETRTVLEQNTHFDFLVDLPGQTAFVMITQFGATLYDPDFPFFPSTFIHELFHDHQSRSQNWEHHLGHQDWQNYPLDVSHIEHVALEDRALRAAVVAEDSEARLKAARHLAALRIAGFRRDSDLHGEYQEQVEGSAAYIEHRIEIDGGGIQELPRGSGAYSQMENMSNFAERVRDLDEVMARDWVSVKRYYTFQRFYRTGAAILHLLDLLGVNQVQSEINQGMSPAEVLIAYLNVTEEEVDQLTSNARNTYDPDGLLRATAVRAAAEAANDPRAAGPWTN